MFVHVISMYVQLQLITPALSLEMEDVHRCTGSIVEDMRKTSNYVKTAVTVYYLDGIAVDDLFLE